MGPQYEGYEIPYMGPVFPGRSGRHRMCDGTQEVGVLEHFIYNTLSVQYILFKTSSQYAHSPSLPTIRLPWGWISTSIGSPANSRLLAL